MGSTGPSGRRRSAPAVTGAGHRARARVEVALPLPPGAVGAALDALVDGDLAQAVLRVDGRVAAVATATRAVGRASRWAHRFDRSEVWSAAFGRAGPSRWSW